MAPTSFYLNRRSGPIERRHYDWKAPVSAADRVGLVATFADHRALTPQQLTTVQAALSAVIEELGGTIAGHMAYMHSSHIASDA